MFLNLENCNNCGKKRISAAWCSCSIDNLRRNFNQWTSKNYMLDNFIEYTQLNATRYTDFLEWIDLGQLHNIKHIGRGAFSSIYSATWREGPMWHYDKNSNSWNRIGSTKVILKRLDGFNQVTQEFIDHLLKYHKLLQDGSLAEYYGITRDPTTSCYTIVMKHYKNADLYTYVQKSYGFLCWRDIVDILFSVSIGIYSIHKQNLFHGNLHGGNILLENGSESIDAKVADIGLNRCANKKHSHHGVISFTAPEVLSGNNPTKESDIYSFGIIMWMLSSGAPPYYDRSHDLSFVREIISGLRPERVENTPPVYLNLLERCLSTDPKLRPTAEELYDTFEKWVQAICDDPYPSELSTQFDKAEDIKFTNFPNISNLKPIKIHDGAIYFSRSLESITAVARL